MMSTETSKKRKIDGRSGEDGSGGGDVEVEKILAEMKAQMDAMQEEMHNTKSRSKNELDEMKSRLVRVDDLERKCHYLEARCGSLERSVQILVKDSNWEYSAPSVPTSHWIDRGFDQDYIDSIQLFLMIRARYEVVHSVKTLF